MVLAALGYLLAAGADPATAIEMANVAGGLEVERLGVVPLVAAEILAELGRSIPAREPAQDPLRSSRWKANCGGGARPAGGSS